MFLLNTIQRKQGLNMLQAADHVNLVCYIYVEYYIHFMLLQSSETSIVSNLNLHNYTQLRVVT